MRILFPSLLFICLTLIYFIGEMEKKGNMKKKREKKWIILNHTETEIGKDGKIKKTSKCYRAEHKNNNKTSPCFSEVRNLNNWLKENGTG